MNNNVAISVNPVAETNFDFGSFRRTDELWGSWTDAHANFISSLSEQESSDLLKYSTRHQLKSRDQLFGAGDRSDVVFIVASGCIRLYQVSISGKETILWFSFPGEIFGIAELCSGSGREIYAEANEPSLVYAIQRSDFSEFLGRHSEVAMRAIGILSARVRTLGHALAGLVTDKVETRIARLLVRFAAVSSGATCCDEHSENELCVNLRLTHQDIANLIGASRQTVTSTLIHLRKQGAVRTVKQHLHVAKPDQLRRILEAETP